MIYALFSAIIGGIGFGYLCLDVNDKPTLDTILMTALNFIILVAGIEIGGNRKLIAQICTPKNIVLAFALPLGTIIGSLTGAYLSSFVTGLSAYESILVASGFGWYSLSSVIISTMHSTELGAIAFFGNMIREVSSFVLIPLLARWHKLMCIAPGAAATMDSLLPLIITSAGMRTGMLSFINGLVTSLLVPVFLSFLLGG